MLERFLERISKSKYADKFILKGGMLVSSFVGIEELDNIRTVLNQVESSENFKEQWNMYCSKFKYAQKYPWHDVVKSVMILSSKIGLLDKFTLKITDERPSILAKISKHKEDISKEDKLTPDKTIHKTNDLEL